LTRLREFDITWHCAQLASSEHCTLIEADDGYNFHGVVVVPLADVPCHIEYSVIVDSRWLPLKVESTITTPSRIQTIDLRRRVPGRWELDGVWASHLEGCDDVDLGWSPATNTIPIRRLDLSIGESASITAAWTRFPELDVVRNVQRYTRLANDRWRYQAGEYEFDLTVDGATGLVLNYGDDMWQASATSGIRHRPLRRSCSLGYGTRGSWKWVTTGRSK
jgi:hypothetical protein